MKIEQLHEGHIYWDTVTNKNAEFCYMGQTGLAIVCEPGDRSGGMQSSWGVKPSELEFQRLTEGEVGDIEMPFQPHSITIRSLMDNGHNNRFPQLSRDWEVVDCKASSCINNRSNQCTVPSLAQLDNLGKCKGFKSNLPDKKSVNPITSLNMNYPNTKDVWVSCF